MRPVFFSRGTHSSWVFSVLGLFRYFDFVAPELFHREDELLFTSNPAHQEGGL